MKNSPAAPKDRPYKSSGNHWTGKIPVTWKMQRVKSLLRERNERGHTSEPLLAATQSQGVVLKEKYDNRTVLPSNEVDQFKLVREGDFVISLRSFQGGIEYAYDQGIISPAYTVIYPYNPLNDDYFASTVSSFQDRLTGCIRYWKGTRLFKSFVQNLTNGNGFRACASSRNKLTRFLDHADGQVKRLIALSAWYKAYSSGNGTRLFKSRPFVQNLAICVTGIREGQNIDYARLQIQTIPVPPLVEQADIVRFLDHADGQIQRYIAAKERLIALLEEHRHALVHKAVTRGLDPGVRLKPSEVEWMGDVPEHWSIRTLGQIADSFRTGPFGSMLHQSDYTEGGTPVINPIHIRSGVIVEDPSCSVSEAVADNLSAYRLAQHDLIFSRRGELGRCALVRDRETNWLCGTGSIRVRIEYASIEPEFLIQALQVQWVGEYLSLASVGATMNNLNTGILKSVPFLVPPIREQRYILEHVGRQSRAIHHVISQAHHQINLMNEYRTRLIADVVTGQLDVRKTADQMPAVPSENKLSDEIVTTQEVLGR